MDKFLITVIKDGEETIKKVVRSKSKKSAISSFLVNQVTGVFDFDEIKVDKVEIEGKGGFYFATTRFVFYYPFTDKEIQIYGQDINGVEDEYPTDVIDIKLSINYEAFLVYCQEWLLDN